MVESIFGLIHHYQSSARGQLDSTGWLSFELVQSEVRNLGEAALGRLK